MATLTFQAKMQIRGINPYVLVTKSFAKKLKAGWRKPMPVLVNVNGKPDEPWHINMMPVGNGDFYLYLHGDVRKVSDTKVGDEVTIELEFNDNYKNGPQHEMPSKLVLALKKNPIAQANWDALPPSRQKEILRYLANLKSTEAVNRNIDKVTYALSAESDHFMGRDWKNGT
ncbi:MAG TPA: YdeI/OmpD-associated family protein [Candidatus Saccharimonadales bacterium]|nr:YdeI/OmpD-associated family protein [Candidatus Saccharimonadales bacterium]